MYELILRWGRIKDTFFEIMREEVSSQAKCGFFFLTDTYKIWKVKRSQRYVYIICINFQASSAQAHLMHLNAADSTVS